MLVLVLSVGVLNLALGFFLALFLEQPCAHRWSAAGWKKNSIPIPWPRRTAAANGPRESNAAAKRGEPTRSDQTAAQQQQPTTDCRLVDLATLVSTWRTKDPDRVRIVSGVMLEIVELATVRERIGPANTAALLAGFTSLLAGLVRQDRGYDRVVRLPDDRALLFLGDTALRNAVNAAERIRQTIANATFWIGADSTKLTVRCAVREWGNSEPSNDWIARLRVLLEQALPSGQEGMVAEDESGPRQVDTPPYQVPAKEVRIEGAAEPAGRR